MVASARRYEIVRSWHPAGPTSATEILAVMEPFCPRMATRQTCSGASVPANCHSVVQLDPVAPPFRRSFPAVAIAVALGLGVLTPRPGHGAADAPPAVLLESLRVASDGVT